MSCDGGFSGCGFTTGGGSYTQSSASKPDDIDNNPEYQPFAVFVEWLFLFLIIMGGGLFRRRWGSSQTCSQWLSVDSGIRRLMTISPQL